ncbi:hypothetical protein EVAR_4797_1 [Eumeta japonica]|uniref:Uncharacterized protein n=1 Tax=Eumeta variegata TaxID=151549 RepID=A0A4C1T1K7_EUMVA|nr:hypothetical protein EVAR_4797_1 [Eumeta japonica]
MAEGRTERSGRGRPGDLRGLNRSLPGARPRPPRPAPTRQLALCNPPKVGLSAVILQRPRCGWESLMKNVTPGNVTMSHRTREARQCPALSHSTMIGLPRAQH